MSNGKLAVIICGGTAGSVTRDGCIVIDPQIQRTYEQILTPIREILRVDVKYSSPTLPDGKEARSDSSDALYKMRAALLRQIEICMRDPHIKGIAVTYGTDTEEMVGNTIYLGGNSGIYKPITICGSLNPSDSENYDFPKNLLTAALFSLYSEVAGVYHVRAGPRLSQEEDYGLIIFHDFGKHGALWHERVWAPQILRDVVAKVYYNNFLRFTQSHLPYLQPRRRSVFIEVMKPEDDRYVDYPDRYPLTPRGETVPGRILGYKRPHSINTRRKELEKYGFVSPFAADYLTWRNMMGGSRKELIYALEEVDDIYGAYNVSPSLGVLLNRIHKKWGIGIDRETRNSQRFDSEGFSGRGLQVIDGLTDIDLHSLDRTKMVIIAGTGAGHTRTLDEESFIPFIRSCRDSRIPITVLAGTSGESASLKYEIGRKLLGEGVWFAGTRSRFAAAARASYIFHPDHIEWVRELAEQFNLEEFDITHQLWCSDMVFPTDGSRDTYRKSYPHIETRVGLLGGMPFAEAAVIAAASISLIKNREIPNIDQKIEFPLPEPLTSFNR